MRITARYFATLRERRGCSSEDLEVPPGSTAATVFSSIFPELSLRVAYAINEATVGPEAQLNSGDELAFLPPIGGG